MRLLDSTWSLVAKSKRQEFGYSIIKDIGSDATWFTKPTGGRYDEETYLGDVQDVLLSTLAKKLPGQNFHIFGSLHFHPQDSPHFLIVPSASPGDLLSLRAERLRNELETGYDLPPIEMIAMSVRDEELKILVFQEPLHFRPSDLDETEGEINATFRNLQKHQDTSQKEVLDLLRHYGHKAALITTRNGRLSEDALEQLSAFAYVPKRVSGE